MLTEAPEYVPPEPVKLLYPDTTGCNQLLLIDNAIQEPSVMANAANDKTLPVTYGLACTKSDLLSLLRSKFTTIDRIAIAFSCQQGSPQPFLDNQYFFTEDETNVYSDNIYFIISLVKEFQVKQLDYLGCSTLQYPLWNQYYNILKKETGITIGASNDQTGNIKYGGDWTLESTGQDIESVYFTQGIEYYKYVLDAYYTTIITSVAGGIGSSIVYNNVIYYRRNSDGNYVSKLNATNGTMITSQFINVSLISGVVAQNAFFISSTHIFIVQGVYLVKYDLSGNGATQLYTSAGYYSTIVGTDSNLYYITVDNDGLNLTRLVKLSYDGSVVYKLILSNTEISGIGPIAIKGDYVYTWRPSEKKMYKINISGVTPFIENDNFLPTVVSGYGPNGDDLNRIQIYDNYMYIKWWVSRIDKFNLSTGLPDSPSAIWVNYNTNYFDTFAISGSKLYIFQTTKYDIYQLTDYSLVCFKEDSLILTDQGYRPVQDLRKGDMVRTRFNGYVPVNMIGKRDIHHPASKERIKDQLYECSPDKYPDVFEPLVVTGCHSILVDEFTSEEERQKTIEVNGDTYLTDDQWRLPACVDERATVYNKPGSHTIYHFALDNDDYYMNYGVYANGLLVETCSKRYLTELANMELIE
jgi:hypothetical protein